MPATIAEAVKAALDDWKAQHEADNLPWQDEDWLIAARETIEYLVTDAVAEWATANGIEPDLDDRD